jgi:tetratricopeptide (TPR) repeat protein
VRLLDAEDFPEEALASALWLRGWAALQKNQYREAIGPLQDALVLVRQQPTVQLEPDDQELAIEICYRLGRALYEDRRYEDAEEAFSAGCNSPAGHSCVRARKS